MINLLEEEFLLMDTLPRHTAYLQLFGVGICIGVVGSTLLALLILMLTA